MSWKNYSKAHQQYHGLVPQEFYFESLHRFMAGIGGLKAISPNASWHLATTTCWTQASIAENPRPDSKLHTKTYPKSQILRWSLVVSGHFLGNAKKQPPPVAGSPCCRRLQWDGLHLSWPLGQIIATVARGNPPLFLPYYQQSEYIVCTCCPRKGRSGHVGHVNSSKKCRFSSFLKAPPLPQRKLVLRGHPESITFVIKPKSKNVENHLPRPEAFEKWRKHPQTESNQSLHPSQNFLIAFVPAQCRVGWVLLRYRHRLRGWLPYWSKEW